MAYESDDLSGPFKNPDKAGLCTPLTDADGSMAYSQPALRGDLPTDPAGYLPKEKK